MRRNAPDILITTPESLYLMLSSGAREILTGVEAIIIDEIHAVAATKRGAHLALTLERLAANQADGHEPQRIGLSATQNPLEEVGRFMVGPRRTCTIVDAGVRKPLDLQIHVPVESMVEPEQPSGRGGRSARPADRRRATRRRGARSGRRSTRRSCGSSRSTARRSSSSTPAAAPSGWRCGSTSSPTPTCPRTPGAGRHRPRPPRLARARGAHGRRGDAQGRRAAVPRGDVVARARHRHGRRRPRPAGRVAEVRRPRPAAHRPRRPQRRRRLQGPHLPEVPRRPARVRGRLQAHARRRRSSRPSCRATRSTCSPSTSSRSRPARPRSEPVAVDDLYALVTRTHSYAELSRALLENVLDMLDGRYPSQEFAELRARIVWDRVGGTIRPRKGARQLAITNAGTIPDRGLFSVTLPDGRRVGELDEEMVYEARAGQTFLLGASTWRIEEIGRDRVIVTPAPGAPGAVPFWKGDGVGRPKELGQAIGAFSRWAVDQAPETLQADYDLDAFAAKNLLEFLLEQQAATRVLPSDRTIVVERFRDEIGDWRLCVLSPYGGRVHAAWGLALSRRIRERYGLESDAIWSDDGIIVHLPDADEPPGAELVMVEPDEVQEAVVAELASSAPVRRALPRERRPRAAHPARLSRQAHAAVAAAPEVAVAAGGGQALPRLPDHPRDLPRVPARRARRARPGGAAARAALARAVAGRGRDADRVAVRLLAAVRLRRDVHVRGRHSRTPSGARRRCRSTASCCASCSARRSCASSSTSAPWTWSRPTCSTAPTARAPRRATRWPTSCAASAT